MSMRNPRPEASHDGHISQAQAIWDLTFRRIRNRHDLACALRMNLTSRASANGRRAETTIFQARDSSQRVMARRLLLVPACTL